MYLQPPGNPGLLLALLALSARCSISPGLLLALLLLSTQCSTLSLLLSVHCSTWLLLLQHLCVHSRKECQHLLRRSADCTHLQRNLSSSQHALTWRLQSPRRILLLLIC